MKVDYALLGVAPEADEREIKRAYAIRLKRTRPDRDPEGYQRLRETFDAAISIAQWRATQPQLQSGHAASSAEGSSTILPQEVPSSGVPADAWRVLDSTRESPVGAEADAGNPGTATPPIVLALDQDEAFDLPLFVAGLSTAATQGLAVFERWLIDHPSLYSIQLKERMARPLMLKVADIEPALRPPMLAILLHFFGLERAGRHDDELAAAIARAYSRAAPSTNDPGGADKRSSPTNLVLRELTLPPNRWRRMVILMVPAQRDRMRRLLARLRSGSLPVSQVDTIAVAYWHAALLGERAPRRWLPWALLAVAVVLLAMPFAAALDRRTMALCAAIAIAGCIAWRMGLRLPAIKFRGSWRWLWLLFVLARLVYRLSSS